MLHLLPITDNKKSISKTWERKAPPIIKDEDIEAANKEKVEVDINNIDIENMICVIDNLYLTDNLGDTNLNEINQVYQRIGVDKLYNVINQIKSLKIKYSFFSSDYQENQKKFCLKLSEQKWIEEEYKEIEQAILRIKKEKCLKLLQNEVLCEWFQRIPFRMEVERENNIKRRLRNILQIPVPDEYKWKPFSPSKTLKEIIMSCDLYKETINNLRDLYIVDDDLYNMGIGTYGRMIDSLWQHIKNSDHQESSREVLVNYLWYSCDIDVIVNILPML